MTTSQANDISLEILEPHLIVLPLPEKGANASIFVQMRILLTNNTTTPFPFFEGILTPELVGSDGQPLQPQQLINTQTITNQSKGLLIPYNRGVMRTFLAKLFWQNDLLQLLATFFDAPKVPSHPNYCWSFLSLPTGTYQLRFTYQSPTGELLCLDSNDDKLKTVQVAQRETLVTPWVTLRLVEPVGTDKKAVEVDGICFETIVSDKIIQVPLTGTKVDIPIKIGLKITNNTSTPYRFIMFDSLIPELRGAEGLIP